MLLSDQILVPCEDFIVRDLGDETIILSQEGDEMHTLDAVGTSIWRAIDGNTSFGRIVESICDEYEVSPGQAKNDAEVFISELIRKGLVKARRD